MSNPHGCRQGEDSESERSRVELMKKQDLVVYGWNSTTERYERSSKFNVEVDGEEGVKTPYGILFRLEAGKHRLRLLSKPAEHVHDKWTSKSGDGWIEAKIWHPERIDTGITTYSGGRAFILAYFRKVNVQELLRQRQKVIDDLTEALNLSYVEVSPVDIRHAVREKWGTDVYVHKWMQLDCRYWTVSAEQWDKLVDVDWVNEKSYMFDRYDCDDFAMGFKANMSRFWGLNAISFNLGYLVLGDKHYGHAFNSIYTAEGKLLLFEPMKDEFSEGKQIDSLKYGINLMVW